MAYRVYTSIASVTARNKQVVAIHTNVEARKSGANVTLQVSSFRGGLDQELILLIYFDVTDQSVLSGNVEAVMHLGVA